MRCQSSAKLMGCLMKPIDLFSAATEHPKHFLRRYKMRHDSRSRGVRRDWAKSFKSLMHWPVGEAIVCVDGKDQQSVFIMRQAVGIDRQHLSLTPRPRPAPPVTAVVIRADGAVPAVRERAGI